MFLPFYDVMSSCLEWKWRKIGIQVFNLKWFGRKLTYLSANDSLGKIGHDPVILDCANFSKLYVGTSHIFLNMPKLSLNYVQFTLSYSVRRSKNTFIFENRSTGSKVMDIFIRNTLFTHFPSSTEMIK